MPKLKPYISKKDALFFARLLAIVALDQVSKLAIRSSLQANESIPLIENFFSISYFQNTGIVFGLFQGITSIIVWLSIAVLGMFLWQFKEIQEHRLTSIASSLIMSGILGNLIDRAFLGYVTDFIHFSFWPAFNLADSCLTIGTGLMVLYFIKSEVNAVKKN